MNREQIDYAVEVMRAAIDEIDELMHINKFVSNHSYSARHYATKALIELERLQREAHGIIK